MSKEVTFNIKATMNERWIDDFCSMLKQMQWCGSVGSSKTIGLYADGDGDFRPKFEIDIEYNTTNGILKEDFYPENNNYIPSVVYDAG